MNSISWSADCCGIGIEPDDDAGRHLHAVAVDGRDRLQHRHGGVVLLAHKFERAELGRLDADEDGQEYCLAHEFEHIRAAWRC